MEFLLYYIYHCFEYKKSTFLLKFHPDLFALTAVSSDDLN